MTRPARVTARLPRAVHPLAWWLWALGLTVAASRTTNPLVLSCIIAVAAWVVTARRSDAPWSRAFRYYLIAGAAVVVIRVVFRILFGGGGEGHVLLPLPEIALPGWFSGITLLGDVTAESLLGGLYDGMRLATMLICLGAANSLANPRRLLRSMPSALHEVSTAVVVALSVFPQLAESLLRVRRARRLRPGNERKGLRGLATIVIPVLEDALDRSLMLAASMDSRGYGRSGDRSRLAFRVTGALLVVGLGGVCVGLYALLDATTPRVLSTPVLVAGLLVGIAGLAASGHGVARTSYRPDPWRLAEFATIACGLATGLLMWVSGQVDPANLNPSLVPLSWPELAPLSLAAVLVGGLPAWITPPPLTDESSSVTAVDRLPAKARST